MTGKQSKLGAVLMAAVLIFSALAMFTGPVAAQEISDSSVALNPADTSGVTTGDAVITIQANNLNGGSETLTATADPAIEVDLNDNIDFSSVSQASDVEIALVKAGGTVTDMTTNDFQAYNGNASGGLQFQAATAGSLTSIADGDTIRIHVTSDVSISGAPETHTGAINVDFATSNVLSSSPQVNLGNSAPIQVSGGSSDGAYSSFAEAINTGVSTSDGATVSINGDVNEFENQPSNIFGTSSLAQADINADNVAIEGSGLPRVTFAGLDVGGDSVVSGVIVNGQTGVVINGLNFTSSGVLSDTGNDVEQPETAIKAGVGTNVNDLTINNSEFNGYATDAQEVVRVESDSGISIVNNTFGNATVNNGDAIAVLGSSSLGSGDEIAIVNNTINLQSSNTGIDIESLASSDATVRIESTDADPIVGGDNSELGITLGSGGTIDGDTTISGVNITDVGGGAAIDVAASSDHNGDLTIQDTFVQSSNNGVMSTSSNVAGALTLSNIEFDGVGNAGSGTAVIDISDVAGADMSVSGISINSTELGTSPFVAEFSQTGTPTSATLSNISITNTSSANSDVQDLIRTTLTAETVDIDGVTIENVEDGAIQTGGTSSLIDADNSGSLSNSNINSVTVTNITVDDVQDSDVDFVADLAAGTNSNTDSVTIDTVSINNTASVGTSLVQLSGGATTVDITDATFDLTSGSAGIDVQSTENDRDNVFVNVTNLSANDTATAIDIATIGGANNVDTVNIENATITNASADAVILNDANIDVANIKASIADSDESALYIQSVATDAIISSELSVDSVNVTTDQDAAVIIDNDAGKVNFDQSSFDNIGDGNSQDAIRVASGLSGTLNVNTTDFDPGKIDGAAINVASLGGSSDINIRETNFNNQTGTALITNDASANVNATSVWWGNVTGPNVVSSTTVNDRFANGANIDDSDSSSYAITPWTDGPSGQAVYGFEGVVNEDGGSPALSNTDVTLSYTGQNSNIDSEFTFNTSGNGEYVAVISEHQNSDFYDVTANTQGFAESDSQTVTIDGSGNSGTYIASQDFNLNTGATVEGVIENASGEPLQSTGNLQLVNANNDEVIVDGFSTNATGGFSEALTPGTYDLKVNHPSFDASNTVTGVAVTSGNTTSLDTNLTLNADTTATLTATVNYANGTAASNTDVTFSGSNGVPSSNDAALPVTKTTDGSGSVQFEIPASDTNAAYTITADASGAAATDRGVAPAPGDTVSRTFALGNQSDGGADTGSPLDGTAGEYDGDADGQITASELGNAVTAFGEGNLTASELGDVVTEFGQS